MALRWWHCSWALKDRMRLGRQRLWEERRVQAEGITHVKGRDVCMSFLHFPYLFQRSAGSIRMTQGCCPGPDVWLKNLVPTSCCRQSKAWVTSQELHTVPLSSMLTAFSLSGLGRMVGHPGTHLLCCAAERATDHWRESWGFTATTSRPREHLHRAAQACVRWGGLF